jgi:hypothetical protein
MARQQVTAVTTPPIKKKRSKGPSFLTVISKIASFFGIKRRLEPWELKAKAAAEAKRARRRERNLRWWANDPTWEGNDEQTI